MADEKLELCNAVAMDSSGARVCVLFFREEAPTFNFAGRPNDKVVAGLGATIPSRGDDVAEILREFESCGSAVPQSMQNTSANEADNFLRVVNFKCNENSPGVKRVTQ